MAEPNPAPEPSRSFDVAVVGGGAAGLYAALVAARQGAEVGLVSRKPLTESASYWAQGGLAAALAEDDSPDRHAADTINAGRGSCSDAAVEALTRESPGAVEELIELGVEFDREPDGSLGLGLEGGHTARRIVHAGGAETGAAITSRLTELVAAQPRVVVLDRTSVLALLSDGERCGGVVTDSGPLEAAATILATGGAAALWRRTTNPWGAIGAGIVLAHAAGAELADLELCQFHPTALAVDGELDGALVTEAVRGEGALLLDASGERFTDELAPRDQVTQAILDRTRADRSDHVWLDLRGLPEARFPNVFATCRRAGLDPAGTPVPVAPAAHYLIGGVRTDLHGRSSLGDLFAIGEVACTGLHGANRLASNSLSECFVFGARAARAAVSDPSAPGLAPGPGPGSAPSSDWRFTPPTERTRDELWRCAGPLREPERLAELLEDPYPLSRLIAASAIARAESRGVHHRLDRPRPDPGLDGVHYVITGDEKPRRASW